jgi:type VI protein secretion system component VasF
VLTTLAASILSHLTSAWRGLAADERGTTTENVIWIAALAALALAVVGLLGPQILAAAKSIVFQ